MPRITFEQVERFVLENKAAENGSKADEFLTPGYKKNVGKILKAQNYVGLIETGDHTVIEILPKIYQVDNEDKIRQIFLKMLKTLRNTPFKHLDKSHLKTTRMPLLEIFISMFLKELSILVKRGIRRDYIKKTENSVFLKGKLKTGEHIKKNLLHKERFFIEYEEYLKNRPENRIVKTTLLYIALRSRFGPNVKRIRNLLYAFSDVDESTNIADDFARCKSNRLMKDYYLVLKWCRVFLKNESFTNFRGKHLAFALLFPMERIFEDYIGSLVKGNFSDDYAVSLQERGAFLIEDKKMFGLVPDIILKKNGDSDKTIIIDTKWKLIDQENYRQNYNISQADLYQVYAYGKKYIARKVILIYPACETFTAPITTIKQYEKDLTVHILPYDLALEDKLKALSILNDFL